MRPVSKTVAGILVTFGTLSVLPSLAKAPTARPLWSARFNGGPGSYDAATAVTVDDDGSVYVTGTSGGSLHRGSADEDYVTIKYSRAGRRLWTARYQGPQPNGVDIPTAIAVDRRGNVYVTGESDGRGHPGTDYALRDYATVKYDRTGTQLWVARYNNPHGGDFARALAVDAAGNVYVTGGQGAGARDRGQYGPVTNLGFATVKYSPNGEQLWVAVYHGTRERLFNNVAEDIAVDGTGNVYVTGHSIVRDLPGSASSELQDYATVKYDARGVEQWSHRYRGPGLQPGVNGVDRARGITVDPNGDVYVTGESAGETGYFDYATLKYDGLSGERQWVARYDGPVHDHDSAVDLKLDPQGAVLVTGTSAGSDDRSVGTPEDVRADYATIKYDPATAEVRWVARYNTGPAAYENATALAVDSLGRVVVTGYTTNAAGTDWVTVRYSPAGTLRWAARFDGKASAADYFPHLALARDGSIAVAGLSNEGTRSGPDYSVVKYPR
jgi:hypothetical protein